MSRHLVSRFVITALAIATLVPALLFGAGHVASSPVAAQSACNDNGSLLLANWAAGALPSQYYFLAPDASAGWQSAIVGFYGIPVYFPAGWSYQEFSDGIGVFLGANDGSAAYVMQASLNVQRGTSSEQAAAQINNWLLGANGTTLCNISGWINGDLPTQYSIVTQQAGGFTSLAYVFVFPNPSTGDAIVSYYAMAGPSASFETLMVRVFLPLMNMYIRTHGAF